MLEEYLRHFGCANQRNWADLLDVAQFCFNLQRSSSTNKSPLELITGQQPLTPHTVAAGYRGQSPRDYQFAKEWQKNAEVARAYLEKASKRMKKWADMKRRPDPFNVGDMVLIKTDQLRRFNRTHRAHKGLLFYADMKDRYLSLLVWAKSPTK